MEFFILGFLPYLTLLVFIPAMAYRIRVWIKTPQPAAITLFPAPVGKAATFWGVFRESLFFPGLFLGDKFLWASAWIFHATLALIVVGHIRVFTDFPGLWAALGINADRMSAISGGTAGLLILAMALVLLARRLAIRRVREVTNFADTLVLLLIIAVLVTGNALRFGEHFNLELTRRYFSQLAGFSLSAESLPGSPMFTLHFLLAQLLFVFLPFSKILHLGGIFFTQTLIQRA
ncbi:MAG: respiratory nitrate reductase subunit gamma [Candidatus Zixiibacteriota bacterium]